MRPAPLGEAGANRAVPAPDRSRPDGGVMTSAETPASTNLRLPMAASTASAGLAWTLVEQRLITWGFTEPARCDARLVLFELVANAVAVTPRTECITVYCHRDATGVRIGVADPC